MPISDKKMRMSLVIEKDDKSALEKIAEVQDCTVNYIICQAIKEYIQNHAPASK